MTTVYLALGSNVGDARGHIARAVELLAAELGDLRQAPLYRSRAAGYTDQPDFVNTALSGHTKLSAPALLTFVKGVERQVGRTPTFRWGPREIDIDIIFYNNTVRRSADLTIPHPSFAERDFVLRPLSDLAPALVDPISGRTVTQLLNQLGPDQRSIVAVLKG